MCIYIYICMYTHTHPVCIYVYTYPYILYQWTYASSLYALWPPGSSSVVEIRSVFGQPKGGSKAGAGLPQGFPKMVGV